MSKVPKVIEFKASTLTAMTAIVRDLDPERLRQALLSLLGSPDDYFSGELAVVDLGQLPEIPTSVDGTQLIGLLGSYGLQTIAVRNAPEAWEASFRAAGMAILAKSVGRPSAQAEPAEETPAVEEVEPPREDIAPTPAQAPVPTFGAAQVIDRPVRSGQQIYAPGTDLILLNGVSPGAEVIADGNIHCYGPLRGRAVAGAQGNTDARIFCSNFGPELLSIAGTYRTFDNGIEPRLAAKPAQARLKLDGEKHILSIEPLQLD